MVYRSLNVIQENHVVNRESVLHKCIFFSKLNHCISLDAMHRDYKPESNYVFITNMPLAMYMYLQQYLSIYLIHNNTLPVWTVG